jgi:acyl-CoA dehydrogenase
MELEFSPKVEDLRARLLAFMSEHVYPNEEVFWQQLEAAMDRWSSLPIVEELKIKARTQGLWNLFLPDSELGPGLSNLEYAPLAEIMGRVHWASEVFNCSAPDTGNMETLERYGTPEQKRQWLEPLLQGKIRSAFSMTEPEVASSDATNIRTSIRREGDEYVINGRKWFTSGAGSRDCKILIVMGKTDPDNPDRHRQQSMILVPKDTPGVTITRNLPVFGWDEAPHGHAEVVYENVRVPARNILLGEGRGFEIAQGRLGPGRIHHCMRTIGQAEVALEKMCRRLSSRMTFGRRISEQTVWQERIAESRIMIDQCRLLTLHAAEKMDKAGNKVAQREIAMIKVAAPRMLCQIVDWAIQAHGAAGVTRDYGLSYQYARARVMRIVDGPDEVHRNQIAKLELAAYRAPRDQQTSPSRGKGE